MVLIAKEVKEVFLSVLPAITWPPLSNNFPGSTISFNYSWAMGNLGHAWCGASLNGTWPYTYNSCGVGTAPNRTINGLLSVLSSSNEYCVILVRTETVAAHLRCIKLSRSKVYCQHICWTVCPRNQCIWSSSQ
ncbi:hypothetical protein EDD18DRAFT_1218238 [Armillaria luteobubalina]|uniref:Uncharacterized protein n=1 Tax=Armillaria luteobubalina TaxID=153913 RepID=A0AA39P247_9AGAR|nr:hypothetical protein EDD18DRAFT_1218238 [Armillaria luteobubalina]